MVPETISLDLVLVDLSPLPSLPTNLKDISRPSKPFLHALSHALQQDRIDEGLWVWFVKHSAALLVLERHSRSTISLC